jgi:hypothetical protein
MTCKAIETRNHEVISANEQVLSSNYVKTQQKKEREHTGPELGLAVWLSAACHS